MKLELNFAGVTLECRDGDLIGRKGTLGTALFAGLPALADRHVMIGRQDDSWFLLVPRNVSIPTLLDGKDAAHGIRYEMRGTHRLQIGEAILTFSVLEESTTATSAPATARAETGPDLPLKHGRLDPGFLETLVNHVHDLIAVVDPDGRRLWNNAAYAEVLGYLPAELRGTDSIVELHPDDRPLVKAVLEESIRTGNGQRIEYRMRHKNGHWIFLESDGAVLPDWQGSRKCLVIIARDVTTRKRVEEEIRNRNQRQFEQAEVLTSFASSKDVFSGNVASCLARVTEAVVNTLGCERGAVWILQAGAAALECHDLFSRTQLQHSKGDSLWSAQHPAYLGALSAERTLAASQAFEHPAFQELRSSYLLPHGIVSKLDAPIRRGDELLGVLSCESTSARDWSIDEHRFASSLVDLILLTMETRERLRAHQELEGSQRQLAAEVAEAARYVRSLLPQNLTGAIETDWRFLPSTQLGGDSFGYHWLDDDHFAMYLLDVVGHGVGAALLSVSALNALRGQALPSTDFREPAVVLAALNAMFPMADLNGLYFTAWYGVFHRPSRTVRYSAAGHPPPVLFTGETPETAAPVLLKAPGMMVGVTPETQYESKTQALGRFSKLYVFSDGAYEVSRPDGTAWTFNEFLEVLKQPRPQNMPELDAIVQQVREVQSAPELPDDCSIVRIVIN